MRLLPALCLITAAASCIPGVPQPAVAQTATTTAQPSTTQSTVPRKAFNLEITNTGGLITVREKDGAYRFAQVIATPDLWVDLEKPKDTRIITLILRDANGKQLWETRLGDGGSNTFGFIGSTSTTSGTTSGSGTLISMTPTEPSTEEESGKMSGRIVIVGDNLLSRAELKGDEGRIYAERRDGAFVMFKEEDGKTTEMGRMAIAPNQKGDFRFSAGDKKVSFALTGIGNAEVQDKSGTIKTSVETRDGKTYMVLGLGNRRILLEVIEGTEYQFKTGDNGEIIINRASAPF